MPTIRVMPERLFTATADYEVIDRSPLMLAAGEVVRVGEQDADWPGWVWVTSANGRGSHVPEEILEHRDAGTAEVRQPFQARDLSVKRNEQVSSLREVKGWHWCRNRHGQEGWLPAYLLRKQEEIRE